MSAFRVAADACANCGASAPAGARFCPACGAALAEGSTVRADVPLHETAPTPISIQRPEPRLFGVAPPNLLLAVFVVAVALALALFVSGHWPYGLIVLGVAALLLAAYLEVARRRPPAAEMRERAQSTWETWRVRHAAAAEARRIQGLLLLVDGDRRAALLELGAAVHRGDAGAEQALRARLAELDGHETALRGELDRALGDAGERIRRARLPVEETVMVLPTEPSPPPGEATPPQPATVPEPYPPPDEGNPPQPARVPEPGPDPAPKRDE